MFTGLVEEIGKIINVKSCVTGKIFTIAADKIFEDLKIGDSVSVNGVCQTVTNINNKQFICETVHETLKKTTMKYFTKGQNVNLERAVTVNTRLGGHIVQGHIDTNGNIIQINNSNGKAEFYISFPCEFKNFLAHTGSICIDGVSLTVAEIFDYSLKVALIPLTLGNTIAKDYRVGDCVNIEFDIIGKYVSSILSNRGQALSESFSDFHENF